MPNKLEVTVSEQLINWFKCFDAIRFGKNGSDVTSAAVRQLEQLLQEIIYYVAVIMDGKTGLLAVLRITGVPKDVKNLIHAEYNNISSLESFYLNIRAR